MILELGIGSRESGVGSFEIFALRKKSTVATFTPTSPDSYIFQKNAMATKETKLFSEHNHKKISCILKTMDRGRKTVKPRTVLCCAGVGLSTLLLTSVILLTTQSSPSRPPPSPPPLPPPSPPPSPPPRLRGLRLPDASANFSRDVQRIAPIAGLSSVVVSLYHREFGTFAHAETKPTQLNRTSYRTVASVSKVVAVAVALNLSASGQVNISTPIKNFNITGFESVNASIADCLTNHAGIPGLILHNLSSTFGMHCLSGSQSLNHTLQRDCIGKLLSEQSEVLVPPKTKFQYGGVQWEIAKIALEHQTARSFASMYEEIVRKPCQLSDASRWTNLFDNVIKFMHDPEFLSRPGYIKEQYPGMGSGLIVQADDLIKIGSLYSEYGVCGTNRIFHAYDAKLATSVIVPSGRTTSRGFGYGMGWWISQADASASVTGAGGSSITLLQQYGLVLATFAFENNSMPGTGLTHTVKSTIYAELA